MSTKNAESFDLNFSEDFSHLHYHNPFPKSLLILDAPNVELVLGKSISADSIYEGGDAYFDCRVNSSPPPDRVNWYHNVSTKLVNFTFPNSI